MAEKWESYWAGLMVGMADLKVDQRDMMRVVSKVGSAAMTADCLANHLVYN